MIEKELKYPNPRTSVEGALDWLSDLEAQKKEWVSSKAKHRFWDSVYMCSFTPLFEDWQLDLDPYSKIGEFLYDEEEAAAIESYCQFLFELLNERIGGDQPDSAYIDHPEWPKVVEGAKKIFELMKKNDEKYGFNELLNKVNGPIDGIEGS
jgi:hypothetical protein